MKQITIFEKNDVCYFLKEGTNINVNGTEYQFRFVSNGIVVSTNRIDEVEYVTVKCGAVEFLTPQQKVFASYKEAEAKAKVINKKNLGEVRDVLKVLEGNYPL
jgi:hypothetical protein